MPNQYEISEDYENELIKRNLTALHNLFLNLNNNDDWENPHRYQITEYSPLKNPMKPFTHYELLNLIMDIENDGIVYCSDAERFLEEEMYKNNHMKLQVFSINSVVFVGIQSNCITISLDDGYIKIVY